MAATSGGSQGWPPTAAPAAARCTCTVCLPSPAPLEICWRQASFFSHTVSVCAAPSAILSWFHHSQPCSSPSHAYSRCLFLGPMAWPLSSFSGTPLCCTATLPSTRVHYCCCKLQKLRWTWGVAALSQGFSEAHNDGQQGRATAAPGTSMWLPLFLMSQRRARPAPAPALSSVLCHSRPLSTARCWAPMPPLPLLLSPRTAAARPQVSSSAASAALLLPAAPRSITAEGGTHTASSACPPPSPPQLESPLQSPPGTAGTTQRSRTDQHLYQAPRASWRSCCRHQPPPLKPRHAPTPCHAHTGTPHTDTHTQHVQSLRPSHPAS